jgi:NAD(P)H-nitrite reductase large subunit
MNYVIIGNSAAGIGAAEAIRKNDADGNITIIASEPHHTYSRPLISYLLLGKTTEEKMKYRGDGFYAAHNCEFLAGKTVVKIDPSKKTVSLDDGQTLPYGKLLVSTGSAPFVPPMAGLETVEKKFTFASLDDAKALDAAVFDGARVLIVGAGLIGLKCAEGISKKAKSVCVDLAPKVLSSILDDDAAALAQAHLEENGVAFHLGAQVTEFQKDKALLSNGETVVFDVLVLAVGVRPNVGLVKDAGGAAGRGITVNAKCETSLPDIYAAGDCTESPDASAGGVKVMALLPNAYMQGETAGLNMSGGDVSFNGAIPLNAIGFFGLHIATAGSYTGDVYFEGEGKRYKKLYYSGDKLNGMILTGAIEKAGVYTSLIRERTPLSSLDFGLICKKPGLMAFSRKVRSEKLGGAI